MLRVTAGGAAIALEVWAVSMIHLGTILQEPPGLCLGKILLTDQSIILGVLGEAYMCEGKRDITAWGGWRAYMAGGSKEGHNARTLYCGSAVSVAL